ncbi:uncharacterized protein LY89DRAFT_685026 [Mollisia scopiformis]|uniref:Uncharacterized protein n=1 Tax=Mollisia scopiformis TaxID=149040 RepID=A0A194XA65_MOLSC|nr:uncharacterized protein LY89DRAFT_685026 [Mollisia scopiformis]KUJ17060.1 hypothetical protein LY89DRAFT_685026 [Mollisia scopiformis]
MARPIHGSEDELTFWARVMNKDTLQISCRCEPKEAINLDEDVSIDVDPDLVYVHRILAIQLSHHFKRCVGDFPDENEDIEPFEISEKTEPNFAQWARNAQLRHLMTCFGAWVYARTLPHETTQLVDLWRFGQIIGSPSFMNAVIIQLSANIEVYFSSGDTISKVITADNVRRCWETSNFVRENKEAVCMEVNWDNKKMLKFFIDVFAHKALHVKNFFDENEDLKLLVTGRDQLALQVLRAIGARGQLDEAPWQYIGIKQYLVNEDMSESRFESDCRWETDAGN